MTGDARVAGDLPPTFEVSGGRAMLPYRSDRRDGDVHRPQRRPRQRRRRRRRRRGDADAGAGDAAAGRQRRRRRHVVARAGAGDLPPDANTQVCPRRLRSGRRRAPRAQGGAPGRREGYTAPRPTDKSARSLAFPPTSSFAPAAADGDGDDEEEGGGGSSPTQYAAGEEVVVRIRALDRPRQPRQVAGVLVHARGDDDAEARPRPLERDDEGAAGGDDAQPYLLQLRNGVAEGT